jgi:hypothetical protein
MRIHAMRMLSLDRKKTPAIKDATPADGFLAALATNGDTGTSRFHGSSWSVEPSDVIYIRSVARPKDRAGWWASPYWSA